MSWSARVPPIRTGPLLALAAVVGAVALSAAPACARVGTPVAQRGPTGEGAGSRYPSRAQFPRRVAKPSEFAHSSSSTGGASAGAAPTKTRSRSSKKPPKRKPGLHGDPARALLAYKAMQQSYYIHRTCPDEG
jgi:hypothetical protein